MSLLLTLAFVAHDYNVGFADTRTLSWSELVSWTLQSRQAAAACPTAAVRPAVVRGLQSVEVIEDNCMIGTRAQILPGVRIGEDSWNLPSANNAFPISKCATKDRGSIRSIFS